MTSPAKKATFAVAALALVTAMAATAAFCVAMFIGVWDPGMPTQAKLLTPVALVVLWLEVFTYLKLEAWLRA